MKKYAGFSIVEVVIVIVVIVIMGAVGWMAYTNIVAPETDKTSLESSNANGQVTVEEESDLDKVDEALDDVKIEDADSTEFDGAVGTF